MAVKWCATAIIKEPVAGVVRINRSSLEGDGQADLRVHGGPDKAVYAYPVDVYAQWKTARPADQFGYGAMGENLSVSTLDESQIFVGDVFAVGKALLQAVQPRMPCYKLGVLYRDLGILRTFGKIARPGVYFKVVREGVIEAGQPLALETPSPERVSIARIYEWLRGEPLAHIERDALLRLASLPPNLRAKLTHAG